jgi:hypothetical protein
VLNPCGTQADVQKYDPKLGQLEKLQFFHRSMSIVTANQTLTVPVVDVAASEASA